MYLLNTLNIYPSTTNNSKNGRECPRTTKTPWQPKSMAVWMLQRPHIRLQRPRLQQPLLPPEWILRLRLQQPLLSTTQGRPRGQWVPRRRSMLVKTTVRLSVGDETKCRPT